jgi:heptosyltransferase-2
MVMAQSLFIGLRQGDPGVSIDVVALPWSAGLLARMPEVRRVYRLDVGHGELGWRKRRELGRRLRANRYGRAIVLPRSFKSALVPFWARIPRRTGFRSELRFGLLNDRRPLERSLDQTVKRFIALGRDDSRDRSFGTIAHPRLRVDTANQGRLTERLGLDVSRPVVAFMPGAEYGPAKQWPVDYFAELRRRLVGAGYRVWVLGSAKEKTLGDAIVAGDEDALNLCGQTRLEDVIDLIALSRAAVSNDSGLMHVAAAVDRPLVAIYGSSSPDCTPPLSERAVVEYLRLECSPCFQRQCPYGHYRCLREISVERIIGAVNRAVDGGAHAVR